jgi:hypothetical protein
MIGEKVWYSLPHSVWRHVTVQDAAEPFHVLHMVSNEWWYFVNNHLPSPHLCLAMPLFGLRLAKSLFHWSSSKSDLAYNIDGPPEAGFTATHHSLVVGLQWETWNGSAATVDEVAWPQTVTVGALIFRSFVSRMFWWIHSNKGLDLAQKDHQMLVSQQTITHWSSIAEDMAWYRSNRSCGVMASQLAVFSVWSKWKF